MGLPRRFRWIHFFVLTNDAVFLLHCKFYFVMIRSVLCSVFSSVHIVSAEEMASSYFDLAALRNATYQIRFTNL